MANPNEIKIKLTIDGKESLGVLNIHDTKIQQLIGSAKAATHTFGGLKDTLVKVGGAFGLAFGTVQLVNFAKEAVTLASKVEGVRNAFNTLNQPNLLRELRESTRGTVNDLILMQAVMRASNFQIPLENLQKFFEFAQKRASQTGESVDYLVDSIVNGIGRKSPLILDNLGISAARLREKFKGINSELVDTPAYARGVAEIIGEELVRMGDVALTTADRIAQLNTKWDHLKIIVGEDLVAGFGNLEMITSRFYGWLVLISEWTGFSDISNDLIKTISYIVTEAGREYTRLNNDLNKLFGYDTSKPKGKEDKKKVNENMEGSIQDLAARVAEQNKLAVANKKVTGTAGEIVEQIKKLKEANEDANIPLYQYHANLRAIERLQKLLTGKNEFKDLNLEAAIKREADWLKKTLSEFPDMELPILEDATVDKMDEAWTNYIKNIETADDLMRRHIDNSQKAIDEKLTPGAQLMGQVWQRTGNIIASELTRSLGLLKRTDNALQNILSSIAEMALQMGLLYLFNMILPGSGALAAGATAGTKMANGGIINEPIMGIGKSGMSYAFGERGSEAVIPIEKLAAAKYQQTQINVKIEIEGRQRGRDLENVVRRETVKRKRYG